MALRRSSIPLPPQWAAQQAEVVAARPFHLAAIGLFMLAVPLCILGMAVDFIPSAVMRGSSVTVAVLVAGALVPLLLMGGAMIVGGPHVHRRTIKIWLSLLIVSSVAAMAFWIIVARAIPWVVTRVHGAPAHLETTMHTFEDVGRNRGCRYKMQAVRPPGTWPTKLCIGKSSYETYPDRDVIVRLHGKRTALGFAITSFEHVREADPDANR